MHLVEWIDINGLMCRDDVFTVLSFNYYPIDFRGYANRCVVSVMVRNFKGDSGLVKALAT